MRLVMPPVHVHPSIHQLLHVVMVIIVVHGNNTPSRMQYRDDHATTNGAFDDALVTDVVVHVDHVVDVVKVVHVVQVIAVIVIVVVALIIKPALCHAEHAIQLSTITCMAPHFYSFLSWVLIVCYLHYNDIIAMKMLMVMSMVH